MLARVDSGSYISGMTEFGEALRAGQHENCQPIREMLSRVGDKWSVLILGVLGAERMRFKALHRAVPGISQRVLVVSLRNLERDGLITRTVYATVPPRVEYEVTPRGRSLRDALKPVADWVIAHKEDIAESRKAFDEQGQGEAALVTKS